jgi:hypothetical protein
MIFTKILHRFHDRPGLTMDICSICAARYAEIQAKLTRDIIDAYSEQEDYVKRRIRWDQESTRLAGDITRGCHFTP